MSYLQLMTDDTFHSWLEDELTEPPPASTSSSAGSVSTSTGQWTLSLGAAEPIAGDAGRQQTPPPFSFDDRGPS